MKKINDVIDDVLIKNNSHWLNEGQVRHSISESKLTITRKDVIDIVNSLPIVILSGIENTHVEIVDGIVIVKPTV